MKNFIFVGVALRRATLDRVEKLAVSNGQSRTGYLRHLIDTALAHAERSISPDLSRLLTLQEHQMLLLDEIVRKRDPETANRLARDAEIAVKKYHGA